MKIGRYRHWTEAVWAKSFSERKARSVRVAKLPLVPDVLWEMDARLILEAYHKGPWRAVWALIKHELRDVWMWYGWPKWEWTRVHVFRLPQDVDIAEFERYCDEMDAVEELISEL